MPDPPHSPDDDNAQPSPRSTPTSMSLKLGLLAFLALGVVLWTAFPRQADDTDGEPDDTSTTVEAEVLAGHVVDSTGRPIAEARVDVGEASTQTDTDGHFAFSDLESRSLELTAYADGHVSPGLDTSKTIDLDDRKSRGDLEVILPEESTVAGRVTAAGEPVDDADISVSYMHIEGIDGEPLSPYVDADITDTAADGQFRLEAVAPGRLVVLVESGGEYAESDEIYVRAGSTVEDVTIDLAPSGRLVGEIVGESGDFIDAEITLESAYADRPSHHVVADGGFFTIDALDEGSYTLKVSAEGHLTKVVEELYIDSDEPRDIELALQQSQGIVGRVLEPDGTPIENAQVTISRDYDRHMKNTDENGRFHWPEITSGQWEVVASSPGHDPSPRTPMRPGDEIALELTPGGSVVGRVLDHRRRPVTEFTITGRTVRTEPVAYQPPRSLPEEIVRDPRGRFDLGPIRSGEYRFTIDSPDHPPATSEDVEIAVGETAGPLTIELDAGAAIEGTVVDEQTDQPLEGATVSDADGIADGAGAETDEYGRFVLDGLPESYRTIRIDHDDYHTEVLDGIDPTADSPFYEVELAEYDELQRSRRITTGIIVGDGERGPEITAIGPDSPAQHSPVEIGDTITAVDGIDTDELSIRDTVRIINGHDESPVTLDIYRSGLGHRTFEVDRQREFGL